MIVYRFLLRHGERARTRVIDPFFVYIINKHSLVTLREHEITFEFFFLIAFFIFL